jgi:hypothetical protein
MSVIIPADYDDDSNDIKPVLIDTLPKSVPPRCDRYGFQEFHPSPDAPPSSIDCKQLVICKTVIMQQFISKLLKGDWTGAVSIAQNALQDNAFDPTLMVPNIHSHDLLTAIHAFVIACIIRSPSTSIRSDVKKLIQDHNGFIHLNTCCQYGVYSGTPLHWASVSGHSIWHQLFPYYTDFNIINHEGRTVLMTACLFNNETAVRKLLTAEVYRIDLNIPDNTNRTVKDYIQIPPHEPYEISTHIQKMIRQAGKRHSQFYRELFTLLRSILIETIPIELFPIVDEYLYCYAHVVL